MSEEFKKYDSGQDWSFADIEQAYEHIRRIAEDKFGLTYYPNQIEIISSEQMLDCYSAVGMPVHYSHWSFGKQFVQEQESYRRGNMGLAYEIVINSEPCIAYLMEENTMMMQCLVMAHACFGHNYVFKNNVHFKQWTDASSIIDYMEYAKNYILECESRYGPAAVENVLDAAHALKLHGVDRYKRPSPLSKEKQHVLDVQRQLQSEQEVNDLWRTVPSSRPDASDKPQRFPAEPEENLLYFIEKHAPNLPQWKREILRIVRKIAQYFYPQMLTQILNEGMATFTHYHIINEMYEEDLVTDGFMLEFLKSHTGVTKQYQFAGINPYALGFAILMDVKRMCLEPTEEDRQWFPDLAGSGDWMKAVKFAVDNFKDESFILQYLSPKVMRDFQLFAMLDDDDNEYIRVEAIHNEEGYKLIREKLAEQQNVNNRIPNVSVVNVDVWGDRSLTLEYSSSKRRRLEVEDTYSTLQHVADLWGYNVVLQTVDENGVVVEETYEVLPQTKHEETQRTVR